MKIGAFVLGLLGGLTSLGHGLFAYALGSASNFFESGSGTAMQIASVGVPLMALLGAGLVLTKPLAASALMAASVMGILIFLGFGFFSLTTVVLLGVASALSFLHWKDENAA